MHAYRIVLMNAYSLFLVRCNVPQVYDGSAFCDSQSLTDANHSGLCHAVQRRNPLHSRSCLSRPRVSYQTMPKHCSLRGNLRRASFFVSKHQLLAEYKGLWISNKTADSSPKDMKDYEWKPAWPMGCESALVMTQTSNVEDRQISAKLHRVATSAKVYLVYFIEQTSYQI